MEECFGLTIPQTLEEVCDPTRVALIIYDMQVGIVSQLPDGMTRCSESPKSAKLPVMAAFACCTHATCRCPKKSPGFRNCAPRWRGSTLIASPK